MRSDRRGARAGRRGGWFNLRAICALSTVDNLTDRRLSSTPLGSPRVGCSYGITRSTATPHRSRTSSLCVILKGHSCPAPRSLEILTRLPVSIACPSHSLARLKPPPLTTR
jgi:hypothetical protein